MRRLIATLFLLAIAATLVFSVFGCAHKLTGALVSNKPPHTVIFVQGPVDTVNHLVQLYWYGTDEDGYVTGYEFKLVNPEDTVAADSAWRPTSRTDSVFAIYTPQGHAAPTLYVRAIDNAGQRDPQPAVQSFRFRNHPPVITWKSVPNRYERSDTTFASLSVSWETSDVDGNLSRIRYRVWLDGRVDAPAFVQGLQYTVPADSFRVNGAFPASGPRTLFVQPIDDGGMAGNIVSTTWYVRSPAGPGYLPGSNRRPGRLLIIDDLLDNGSGGLPNPAALGVDSLYLNTAIRNLPADSWAVLKLEKSQPFRTNADIAQTLGLFDAVIWYRGAQDTLARLMGNFEPGLGSYLDSGGRLFLEGLGLIQGLNAPGALSQEFAVNYLDCEPRVPLRSFYRSTTTDSSAGWGNVNGSVFISDIYAETITQQVLSPVGGTGGLRAFNVKRRSDIAIVGAPPSSANVRGSLSPASADSLPVGVSVLQLDRLGNPQVDRNGRETGARAVVISFPIQRPGNNAPTMLARIYDQLGLIGP